MKYIRTLLCCSLILTWCSISSRSTNNWSSGTWSQVDIVDPYTIGSVDTSFQIIGPDHKIELWAVPDPKVAWVTCFYSRAKTGGIKGGLWLATDTSDASVACRQTWPISFLEPIALQEEIYTERSSILFKKMRIVRFYDWWTNSLIYLVYSDKLIDGSPKNSISAVALQEVQAVIEKD